MAFHTDRQRKAFFASRGNPRTNITPRVMKRTTPKLRKTEREFIADKIRKNIREGKPRKQAIAIGFSQARAKFGKSRIPELKNQKTNFIDKRTRRLLVLLLGTALFLQILRQTRQ